MKATVAMLTLSAVTAGAQELAIKDFVLGQPLEQEAAKVGFRCRPSEHNGIKYKACMAATSGAAQTIAGVQATFTLLMGLDDKLGSITYYFAQSDFAIVRAAFQDKYPGLRCVDSVVQNRMGAKFDQTECTLETKDASLSLTRRDSDLTQGSVALASAQHKAAMAEAQKQRDGQAKKDI